MKLGQINFKQFLKKTQGQVRGQVITDAKYRTYAVDYQWQEDTNGELIVYRSDGTGEQVNLKPIIELDESLISFFGLYSGDGSKGSEDPNNIGIIKPTISFSQAEPNLIKFAIEQFRIIFPNSIRFTFSLGEDSAYFMAGEGKKLLTKYYQGAIPNTPLLKELRSNLNDKDQEYLKEKRNSALGNNEEHLAFYYFHKSAMESILTAVKRDELRKVGVILNSNDKVQASLRRPFKKGARTLGGSSRADEIHVGGIRGMGELFLKILHEIEDSILIDSQISTQGLIEWNNQPSQIGQVIDINNFFTNHAYGQLAKRRPSINTNILSINSFLIGKWYRSKEINLKYQIQIDPLWCYTSGLYLAEGTTKKEKLFLMFKENVTGLAFGFTSSENNSLELILKSLNKLFEQDDCLSSWKVKVGSQYLPELVVTGLKNGVPMLRGGSKGQGKLRTMEISLSIKEWALKLAPCLQDYTDKYSHVEPTGAGLPRIDFSASSVLCRWYFPLIMYATFGQKYSNPITDFS